MRPIVTEIEHLRNLILEMGGLVEAAVHDSVRSLREQDEAVAAELLASEARINRFEMQIDEVATRVLALNQPVARDLRMVTAALKINKDLERMGDLAVNIAERSLSVIRRAAQSHFADIPAMSRAVEAMVRDALDAFVRQDQCLAQKVIGADDGVDEMKHSSYRELIGRLDSGEITARAAFDVIFVAHNLERIADHAANIAEDVLFMITGADVRHPRLR